MSVFGWFVQKLLEFCYKSLYNKIGRNWIYQTHLYAGLTAEGA
jgi:hypothetical protein